MVFLLGVIMTRHLSPLYWAGHDKETVGLLVPAVLVALVGVVVVALAWGPAERRTKALAVVPRIAWGVAGLIVLLAVVGATRPFWLVSHHFVRADFTIAEEILQKAKHIKVDGTRDYAENSMTWIGWYYGVFVVIAGVLGAAWLVLRFGRTGTPALVAFLLVFLASAVLFLYYPNIAPDQIWVMRRYLPIVIPGFVIAAAYVGHQLGLRGRAVPGRRRGAGAWPALASPSTPPTRWLGYGRPYPSSPRSRTSAPTCRPTPRWWSPASWPTPTR